MLYVRNKVTGKITEIDDKAGHDKIHYVYAENVRDLIQVGDLIKFGWGHTRTVESNDIINGHIPDGWKIAEVYTKCDNSYNLVLRKIGSTWDLEVVK